METRTLFNEISLQLKANKLHPALRILPFLSGLLFLGFLLAISDPHEIAALLRPDMRLVALALIVTGIMYWVQAIRWQILTSTIAGHEVSTTLNFYMYLLSAAILGLIFPQSASTMAIGTTALNQVEGVPLTKAAVASLLENMLGTIAISISLLPALGIALGVMTKAQALLALMIMLIVVTLLVLTYQGWLVPVARVVKRRLPLLQHVPEIPRQTVWQIYQLSLMSEGLLILRVWFLAQSLHIPVAPLIILLGVALNNASQLISITPGGMGIKEGAWYMALNNAIPHARISPFLLGHRAFLWVSVGVLWIIGYALVLARRHRVPPAP